MILNTFSFLIFFLDLLLRINIGFLSSYLIKTFDVLKYSFFSFTFERTLIYSIFQDFFSYIAFVSLFFFTFTVLIYSFSRETEKKYFANNISLPFFIMCVLDLLSILCSKIVFLNYLLLFCIMLVIFFVFLTVFQDKSFYFKARFFLLKVPMELYFFYCILKLFSGIFRIYPENYFFSSLFIYFSLISIFLIVVFTSLYDLTKLLLIFYFVYLIGILCFQASNLLSTYKFNIVLCSVLLILSISFFIRYSLNSVNLDVYK